MAKKNLLARAVASAQSRYRNAQRVAKKEKYERESKDLIAVHTLPKSGSMTVWNSLMALDLEKPIYHIHFLSQQGIDGFLRAKEKKGKTMTGPEERLAEVMAVRRQYLEEGKHCHVVTLIREPVGAFVSSFFQGWRYNIPHIDDFAPETLSDAQVNEWTELLLKKKDDFLARRAAWFREEIEEIFGIDIFAQPFDKARGYQMYEGNRAGLLLIRLESLNDCHQAAFRDFLGLENFQLLATNVAADKKYSDLYQKFCQRVPLPQDFLEAAYDLPYMHHMYTPQEIEGYRRKWERD